MTITKTLNNFLNETAKLYQNLVTGKCNNSFKSMSNDKKLNTIIKCGLVAAAAGIFAGIVTASSITSLIIMVSAGAFAYAKITTDYGPVAKFVDNTVAKFQSAVAELSGNS